jgi:TRAP-type C4-dicarboxylate transport system substrate-binding protein
MGFQIVEMDWSEAGNKLNAGVISAAYQNPAAVAAFGLHTKLKNMMSTNVAPVMGGIVINQVTWKKIGELNPGYQQALLNVTRSIATEFDASLQRTVNEDIQKMVKTGLTVNRPTAAQEQLWYNDIEKTVPSLLGTTYDRNLYQRITTIVTRIRGGL